MSKLKLKKGEFVWMVLKAFGVKHWTAHQARVTVQNLNRFAKEIEQRIEKNGGKHIDKRISENFGCLRITVYRQHPECVAFIRDSALDVSRKEYRNQFPDAKVSTRRAFGPKKIPNVPKA